MTLTQLEYIVAVDTYRSFIAAAEKCFVTQPTLSVQVQKLEETLGIQLFDRSRQPVTATDTGAEVIAQARIVLAEAEKIKEIIKDRDQELSGELRFGIIQTVAPYIVPRVLNLFAAKYPQVKLKAIELPAGIIVQQLKSGLMDCGILSTPLNDSTLTEEPLFYDGFAAYVSKGSKLYKKKHVSPEDLDTEDLWLLNEGHCMRAQVLNIRGHQHFKPATAPLEYNTGSIDALKRMVDQGNGFTLLPELSLAEMSDKQLDKVRYFKTPEPAREISLLTARNILKRRLIEALKNEILGFLPKKLKSAKKKSVINPC